MGSNESLSIERVGGGCIHPAARLETGRGRVAFLKWSPEAGPSGFGVEARGLEALAERGGIRTPEVLGWARGSEAKRGWLLLEYIEPGTPRDSTPVQMGRGLARLHRPIERGEPGWDENGWIGPLAQENGPSASWPAFWRDRRLAPQWRMAEGRFDRSSRVRWNRLMDLVEGGLEGSESAGVSLLHGDLWSGNMLVDVSGRPVLVDPAAYRGHAEVDLAMMELFGGFGEDVFEAYDEESRISPGYRRFRRDIYQLYPLLVHVNLFGAGYVAEARSRIDHALAALG